MHRVLVNALSVNNQSGLHVLAGHLEQLVERRKADCRFVILGRDSMEELKRRFAGRTEWISAPACTARWLPRAIWEWWCLNTLVRRILARAYFTPSGLAASDLTVPQAVLCQNPWAMVPAALRRRDALKAWLQRRAYRKTMHLAAAVVFNSEFMQQAYRKNAGFNEKRGLIVYQAAEESTRLRAAAWKGRPRTPGQILCVSAMAPHKNIETLLRAFQKLKDRNAEKLKTGFTPSPSESSVQSFSLSAFQNLSLHLAGPWPDRAYEKKIRALVADSGLSGQVVFEGFVPREALDRLYAESQVFCLMSRCESFGIPAIEAQLFGTPVVSSTACAVPEICGDGGLFFDPDDAAGVAGALERLLGPVNTNIFTFLWK